MKFWGFCALAINLQGWGHLANAGQRNRHQNATYLTLVSQMEKSTFNLPTATATQGRHVLEIHNCLQEIMQGRWMSAVPHTHKHPDFQR